MAVSSRGLGRGPLKAQTRVRIPLPLLVELVDSSRMRRMKDRGPVRLSVRSAAFHGEERGSMPLRAIVEGEPIIAIGISRQHLRAAARAIAVALVKIADR